MGRWHLRSRRILRSMRQVRHHGVAGLHAGLRRLSGGRRNQGRSRGRGPRAHHPPVRTCQPHRVERLQRELRGLLRVGRLQAGPARRRPQAERIRIRREAVGRLLLFRTVPVPVGRTRSEPLRLPAELPDELHQVHGRQPRHRRHHAHLGCLEPRRLHRVRAVHPALRRRIGYQAPPAWSTLTGAVHDGKLEPFGKQMLVHQKPPAATTNWRAACARTSPPATSTT